MTYINFITGLIIAAVLSVPGAMQHEATQVGEELVLEGVNLQEEWFIYTVGHPTTLQEARVPSNYTLATPSCLEGDDVLCAIKAMPIEDGDDTIPNISGSTDAALVTYFGPSGVADPSYIELKSN